MKKVALFSDGWKRLITYAWVEGMMQFISQSDEKISLYQYNCNGNWSLDKKHNHGEYNIYTLPDISDYDGIIIDCSNILDKRYFDKLVDMVRKSGKPAVSIVSDVEGFYYAGIDNRNPIADIMDHMYYTHHCRSYVFAGGPKENYENMLRVSSYLESLDRLGLSREDNPVWFGDYDFDTGAAYFEQYRERFGGEKITFPDVFVCANDNIAAGLCYKAQQYGYRIPEDFRVTGFDNLDKAMYFEPQITTVGHMRENIGNKTMEILADIWAGKDVPRNHFMPSKCIFSESCGCPNSGLLDYRKYARNQVISEVDKLKKDELLIKLESNIVKCKNYDEVFKEIAEYFMSLECDGYAIVVDKRLYEGAEETEFAIDGYDWDNMVIAYAVENGKVQDFKGLTELFAYDGEHGAGNTYMFTPIHFRERAVGFSILKNGKFLYDNPYFYDIHSTITKTLENLYKKLQLEIANQKMREIYNRDQLTGLYNRIAYAEMIGPKYRGYCDMGRKCAIHFIDADNFKQINDTYGHEKGDMILKEIAQALVDNCPKDGYVYRYGGDEFVVFFPLDGESGAEDFRNAVTARLDKDDISVSIGMTVTEPSSDRALDDYMKVADDEMYRVKAAKKEKGGAGKR